MARQTARVRLGNGLRVNLISESAQARGAALMRINAGSYLEPAAWPGLAHLLEHMLFHGSQDFRGQESVMRWVPTRGGRLNATTLETQTAFFFELDAPDLAAGVARLVDMLVAPLLPPEALAQEVDIIDAEYRLLRGDADTLCEAAQRLPFTGITAMQQFHVGNRAAFGDDTPALNQALHQFYRRHYVGANMTLWLQGPQSLAELGDMAENYGSRLLPGTPPPQMPAAALSAGGDRALRLSCSPQLRLTFALNGQPEIQRPWLRLLEYLLLEESAGGLMAWLRERECCDALRLSHARCGQSSTLLTLVFTLNQGSPGEAAAIEAALFPWLRQLASLTEVQLSHYCRQANAGFARLAPLIQLRARAFGLPPVPDTRHWAPQLAALSPAAMSRLWVNPSVAGVSQDVQGFPMVIAPLFSPPVNRLDKPPGFVFFPVGQTLGHAAQQPQPPASSVPLCHLNGDLPPVLLLRPSPGTPLSEAEGYRLQAALRTLAAEIAHHNGRLVMEYVEGIWLLQLSGSSELMCHGVNALCQSLSTVSAARQREAMRVWQRARLRERGEIAIRRLLAQLPRVLAVAMDGDNVRWQGTLVGGTAILHQRLAQLLSPFPAPIVAIDDAAGRAGAGEDRTGRIDAGYVALSERGDENALLLFYPVPEMTPDARLGLRLLARFYTPRYFQRLRIELNIGYVVQCTYHCCADVEGILFALQSPRFTVDELMRYTHDFMRQMDGELAQLSETELQQAKNSLWHSLSQCERDPLQRAREKVLYTRPSPEGLVRIGLAALLAWHQRLPLVLL